MELSTGFNRVVRDGCGRYGSVGPNSWLTANIHVSKRCNQVASLSFWKSAYIRSQGVIEFIFRALFMRQCTINRALGWNSNELSFDRIVLGLGRFNGEEPSMIST